MGFWRYGIPLIVVGVIVLSAAAWAVWFSLQRRRREQLEAAERQRIENKKIVDDWQAKAWEWMEDEHGNS